MQQPSRDKGHRQCSAYDTILQGYIDSIDDIADKQQQRAQESYEMMLWWKFCCDRIDVQWIRTNDEEKIRNAATYRHVSISYLEKKFDKPPRLTDHSSSSSCDDDQIKLEPVLATVHKKRK